MLAQVLPLAAAAGGGGGSGHAQHIHKKEWQCHKLLSAIIAAPIRQLCRIAQCSDHHVSYEVWPPSERTRHHSFLGNALLSTA